MNETANQKRYELEDRLTKNDDIKGLRMVKRDLHCHRKGSLTHSYAIARHYGIAQAEIQKIGYAKEHQTQKWRQLDFDAEQKLSAKHSNTPSVSSISLGELKGLLKDHVIPFYLALIKNELIERQLDNIIRDDHKKLFNSPRFKSLMRQAPCDSFLSLGDVESIKSRIHFIKSDFDNSLGMHLATRSSEHVGLFGRDGGDVDFIKVSRGMLKVFKHELQVARDVTAPGNATRWNDGTVVTIERRRNPSARPRSANDEKDFSMPKWDGTTQRQTQIIKRGMDFEHQYNVDFRPATDNSLKKAVDKYLDYVNSNTLEAEF